MDTNVYGWTLSVDPGPALTTISIMSWASKLEGMRSQLASEDTEQKKLEEEIARSRIARQRRSQGLGGTNSLDLSKSSEYASALRNLDATTPSNDRTPTGDRQSALNKLTGMPQTTTMRPEPMSLAAFIGGKATGPRLNKHAPQQDATDPTQFEQRTRIDAPHPVFGRGGIAMPGMAGKFSHSRDADHQPQQPVARAGRTPEPEPLRAQRRRSTPSPEKQPETPQKISVRERTVSTPTGSAPIFAPKPASQSVVTASSTTTTSPLASKSRPHTPLQSASPASSKPVVVTPSLARPAQPQSRSSPQGPQISSSPNPSQAFMRPPVQKDLTPSLSRLQGRGFVQNMVKVSSQLETPRTPSPSSGLEKSRPQSERKASVLDRWPGLAATSPSPPQSPTSPIRRSRTTDPTIIAPPPAPSAAAPRQVTKSFSADSAPKANEALGSASTLVVFQPKNYGVDEFGLKRNGTQPASRPAEAEPSKPLLHPTKDRAKKPKKSSSTKASGREDMSSMFDTSDVLAPAPSSLSSSLSPSTPSPPARPPSPIATPQIASSPPDQAWSHKAIPPKPVSESRPLPATPAGGMVGRRALPGMTQPGTTPSISPKPSFAMSPPTSAPTAAPRALPGLANGSVPPTPQRDAVSPTSSAIQGRPSSSGRPSVMEMAQALAQEPEPIRASPPPVEEKPVEAEPIATPRPRNTVSQEAQERRRSTVYERYSIVMPSLKEEATPDPTPHSTLTRTIASSYVPDIASLDFKLSEPLAKPSDSEQIHFNHADEPLPPVDVSPFTRYIAPSLHESQTIQVDVLSIAGNTAFPLANTHVLYETEILAIVHRSKSSSTGLMNSTVWSWQGKHSSLGDSEERKLAELAKRYGTSIVPIRQHAEPVELVQCLGGTLAIRQGSRAHWANENTALHAIRKLHGVFHIDQVELTGKNLCSGFSYCLSLLDTIYVWHGRGSLADERQAALEYAQTLTSNPDSLVVLVEGEEDAEDAEMFWMALCEDEVEYGNADYWRWRPSVAFSPRLWSIDVNRQQAIQNAESTIFVLDCVFELFVLVPSAARGKRYDIRLGLSVTQNAAKSLSSIRPFTPTVHVLVLPSQIPVDVRAQFRELEDIFASDVQVDHMNVLTTAEAQTQLQTSSWTKGQLENKNFMPLGVGTY
ncbi:hypothetical protein MKEN_00686800 [Mycena kentingensis (nom. inval.)]|nr:hypothetical protein MKEN_00686800 [Mycena kentingensis (nom. inval.)]